MPIPVLKIGIMKEESVTFSFDDAYVCQETGKSVCGRLEAKISGSAVEFDGKRYEVLTFRPTEAYGEFTLEGVTIGVDFHWQRKKDQRYQGSLTLLANGGKIQVINETDPEDYLTRVISAEMNSEAPEEFLKAHAVISRSWLMAQIEKKGKSSKGTAMTFTKDETIRWYDREDHVLFDVCADDHCQRYQGIIGEVPEKIKNIISQTRGEVMTYSGEICDTRFSKCCGGVSEEFEHCWQNHHYPYLEAVRDSKDRIVPDLTKEDEARKWILSSPDAFCNTKNKEVLEAILNDYDQETTDFYRWSVRYTRQELSELIRRKSGKDLGEITELTPLSRGKSGRIDRLRITGSKGSHVFGKELEIRRVLSETHLYSSAFIVETHKENEGGLPSAFTFRGAGWGHGVGLCQIGAAVMSYEGYDYRQILEHYFKGASLQKLY